GPGLSENAFGPQPPTNPGEGVGETHRRLSRPRYPARTLRLGQSVEQQGDYRVQPEQARGGTQHRLLTPTPCRFQTQTTTEFLERGLDVPATAVQTDDRRRRKRHIRGKEVLLAMRARP